VSTPETVLLGAIAGGTIFLGLPLGRLRDPRPGLKAFLNAGSAGILLFLVFEILGHAFEPLEEAVTAASWGRLAGMGAVFAVGLASGLLSLLYLGKWQRARRAGPSLGPGAMAATERARASGGPEAAAAALRLGMSVATGIGLHNFSEGLAIGQAANGGEMRLAILLVVGFALHNSTEGFGIVGPLAAGGVRASWSYLALAGLIGGGPTFLGTLVGTVFVSEYLTVLFLTLAAGAIVYVISEMLNTGRRLGAWDVTVWGILIGFLLGAATELVLVAAGA
jgi:zinc transporter, ZIP family